MVNALNEKCGLCLLLSDERDETGKGKARDEIKIKELDVSTAYLSRNQAYKGYSMVVFNRHEVNLDDLSKEEKMSYFKDMLVISSAIVKSFKPDKMNYELLGNWTPHLHWHVVPRYKDDPTWGNPIWVDVAPSGRRLSSVKKLDEECYRKLKETIRSYL